MIRQAEAADAGAVAAIWNHYIAQTAVTFASVVKSVDDVQTEIAGRERFLVAELDGEIAGFATWTQFRGGNGYRFTLEHTILMAPRAAGQGTGRALMARLVKEAAELGYHTLWAGIRAENPGAVDFHRKQGFAEIARLPEVGYKFGRWMDLILMQRRL